MEDRQDEAEIYWFIKWVKMRYLRNKLLREVQELSRLEVSKVHLENLQLKKTLEQIRTEYQPIKKKIHVGKPKGNKGYGRR